MKHTLVGVCLLSALITGCVSQKKYKELQSGYDQLISKNNELAKSGQECNQALSVCKNKVGSLEDQLTAERANLKSLQSALDKCLTSYNQGNVNISKLLDEINASNKYIQRLIEARHKSDSLLLVLTNNLTRSLSQNELKDVDVQVLKGVVFISLSDNMLYKTGSYEISAQAGSILDKIAKIINDYPDYEVLIEGNTDTVPISRPNIRNNWDLSTLRASSVVQALQNDHQVDPRRMTAGGRGEYNPVATNTTEAGRSLNRRTQIIIKPTLTQFMDLINHIPEGK
jgi:chemotaxis protein MotB